MTGAATPAPPLIVPDTVEVVVALPHSATTPLRRRVVEAGGTWDQRARVVVARVPLSRIGLADEVIAAAADTVAPLVEFAGDGLPADVPRRMNPPRAPHAATAALADYRTRCDAWWRDRGADLQAAAVLDDEALVAQRRRRAPEVLRARVDQAVKVARQDGVDAATIARVLAEAGAAASS